MDLVAVNIKTYGIFDGLNEGETQENLLERANQSKQKAIRYYKQRIKEQTGREKEVAKFHLKAAQETEYRVMSLEEFHKGQRELILRKEKIRGHMDYIR